MARKPIKHHCNACSKYFNGEIKFVQHSKQAHSNSRPYQCIRCQRNFKRYDHLKRHIQAAHKKSRPYQCTFGSERRFDQELEMQKQTFNNFEKICDKRFSTKDKMLCHLAIHTNPAKKKVCDQVAHDLFTLKKHQHLTTGRRKFKCSICSKLYTRKTYLKEHEELHKEKSIACPEKDCNFVTRWKGYLPMHNIRCHGLNRKVSYDCKQCLASFINKRAMKVHKCKNSIPKFCAQNSNGRSIHVEWKNRLRRKFCTKGFSRNSELEMHTRSHRNKKSCKGRAFQFRKKAHQDGNLKEKTGMQDSYAHESCSKEDEQFQNMTICQKQNYVKVETSENHFSQNGFEVQHFTCPFCEFGFNCYTEFGRHLRIHTREVSPARETISVTRELRVMLLRIEL